LITETRKPCPRRYGMTREISVVFPAPLQPATPITFIRKSPTPSDKPAACPYLGYARMSCQPRVLMKPPIEPFDPFFNANTVDDLAQAERLAALDGNPSER
jgi:hypothetical protein